MRAKLIKLQVVEEMDVRDYQPEIHKIVMKNGDRLLSDYSGLPASMDVNYDREIYKAVVLTDENMKKEWYYIEFNDFKKTMLFVDSIIEQETREFRKREIDYKIAIRRGDEELNRLNKMPLVRFSKWINKIIRGLK